MQQRTSSIPKPLVTTNQWFIVISVLSTWIVENHYILLLPLVTGLSSLIFNKNPLMNIAKRFFKKPASSYPQEDFAQQRFNQYISVMLLSLGFISYLSGFQVVGFIFTAMVALAALIAILGFCVGCFVRYKWIQYNYRKKLRNES
ncbi:DUF4395 domain-containing protein [Cytobacillus sp. FJAT-54145]|uniref:DUF4395 domain-containing protein n=1 Tax=Cytobacillus spartinae TaxID=3299023 RepID=A0ABW6K7K8_9BACI